MEREMGRWILCRCLPFFLLMTTACASRPILKMPEKRPPIVHEYRHVRIPTWENKPVSAGLFLYEGDVFTVLTDKYFKRLPLKLKIGDEYVFYPGYFIESPASGNLSLQKGPGLRDMWVGVDIIVWKTKDWDQMMGLISRSGREAEDPEEIENALSRARELKRYELAEEAAVLEIAKTQKELHALKAEEDHQGEPESEALPEAPEAGDPDETSAFDQALPNREVLLSQLEAKLERLRKSYQNLQEEKKAWEEERKRNLRLRKEWMEKGKWPPVIVIASPEDAGRVEVNVVQITGVVEDDKGLVRYEVLVNGRPLPDESGRGIRLLPGKAQKRLDFKESIPLDRGANEIVIRATDTEGLSSEKTLSVHCVEGRKRIWAVVIGINAYQNVRPLKYAVRDARAFHRYLGEHIGVPEENIFCLMDGHATKREIESVLGTRVKRRAGKEDLVIIFYAGHGAVETDPGDPDGDGYEKYLLPFDAELDDLYSSSISMKEIGTIFRRIRAERVIFIADTCYSGASGGRTLLASGARATLSDKFLERVSRGKGRVILSACSANEISREDDRLQHGIFTYYLLRGLRGKADRDSDGIITVNELFSYLSKEVPEASGQDQHPVRKGETEGELVIGQTPSL